MHSTDTVYVTYIAAPPEAVWAGLTQAEFTRQYFFGHRVESDWQAGSAVRYFRPDGVLAISGRVLRADPPRLLSFTWKVEGDPLVAKLPECIVTFRLEELGGVVRLTLIEAHPDLPDKRLLEGGRRGWPAILSGLKTLLETGRPFPSFDLSYQQQAGAEAMRVLRELYPRI
jgi:uncharacterized protein YndB with AHSA1/START domain